MQRPLGEPGILWQFRLQQFGVCQVTLSLTFQILGALVRIGLGARSSDLLLATGLLLTPGIGFGRALGTLGLLGDQRLLLVRLTLCLGGLLLALLLLQQPGSLSGSLALLLAGLSKFSVSLCALSRSARLSSGVGLLGVQFALALQIGAADHRPSHLLYCSGHPVECLLSNGFHVELLSVMSAYPSPEWACANVTDATARM